MFAFLRLTPHVLAEKCIYRVKQTKKNNLFCVGLIMRDTEKGIRWNTIPVNRIQFVLSRSTSHQLGCTSEAQIKHAIRCSHIKRRLSCQKTCQDPVFCQHNPATEGLAQGEDYCRSAAKCPTLEADGGTRIP